MRIACYYPWVYLRSGVERTILETCLRSRHEYTILTNHFEPENTYPEFKDLQVVELDYVSVDRKMGSVLKAATVVGRQKLDLSSYDLLVVHCDGLGSLILNRKLGIPAVCVCHTPMRPVYDPHYRARVLERSRGLRRLGFHLFSSTFRSVDRFMWSRYKYVFFASDEGRTRAERGGLLNTMESRHEVLHTGIDTMALQPSGCFEHYFLVSGRIMWTKNIELAVRAFVRFKALSPSFKYFRLVIAGMVDRKSEENLKEGVMTLNSLSPPRTRSCANSTHAVSPCSLLPLTRTGDSFHWRLMLAENLSLRAIVGVQERVRGMEKPDFW
jgi:glycosyltransferase involved in cell wall biosynthesis